MAKKVKNSYFNLFNTESDYEEQNISNDEEVAQQPNFLSIVQLGVDENDGPTQTTMFENDSFNQLFNTSTEYSQQLNEEVATELVVEPVAVEEPDNEDEEIANPTVIEESPATEEVVCVEEQETSIEKNDSEPVVQSSIEPAHDNSDEIEDKNQSEEDKIVLMLETNPLDEEYTPAQIEYTDASDDIFNNLRTYDEIKKEKNFEDFETPYLFRGKTSERIRYRLHVPSKKKPKQNRIRKNFMSWFTTIISAVLIAVLLRSFVFVIATVDGDSMLPTLEHNEKLFVTKYTYKFSDIQRGDVVICKYDSPAYSNIYVKRVIGLGGEIISIVDGKVLINNVEVLEDYVLAPCILDMDPVYIPQGYVFVMGDNRNNSADSRKQTIGPLKEELIVGKVQFIISPLSKFGALEDKK